MEIMTGGLKAASVTVTCLAALYKQAMCGLLHLCEVCLASLYILCLSGPCVLVFKAQ